MGSIRGQTDHGPHARRGMSAPSDTTERGPLIHLRIAPTRGRTEQARLAPSQIAPPA